METVSLHGRAWESVIEELEYSIETMKRSGRPGRADDLQYVLDQIQDQRQEGADPNGADLDRYESAEEAAEESDFESSSHSTKTA